MSNSREITRSSGTSVEEAKPRLKKPRMYRVLLMNDDYTPMEFVVTILRKIFRLTEEQSVQNLHEIAEDENHNCQKRAAQKQSASPTARNIGQGHARCKHGNANHQ